MSDAYFEIEQKGQECRFGYTQTTELIVPLLRPELYLGEVLGIISGFFPSLCEDGEISNKSSQGSPIFFSVVGQMLVLDNLQWTTLWSHIPETVNYSSKLKVCQLLLDELLKNVFSTKCSFPY